MVHVVLLKQTCAANIYLILITDFSMYITNWTPPIFESLNQFFKEPITNILPTDEEFSWLGEFGGLQMLISVGFLQCNF